MYVDDDVLYLAGTDWTNAKDYQANNIYNVAGQLNNSRKYIDARGTIALRTGRSPSFAHTHTHRAHFWFEGKRTAQQPLFVDRLIVIVRGVSAERETDHTHTHTQTEHDTHTETTHTHTQNTTSRANWSSFTCLQLSRSTISPDWRGELAA